MQATILIADDNPEMCSILQRMLRSEGHTTIVAVSGRAALQAVSRFQPDLVLLDVTLPDIDGYTVCRRLKADERTALIPVTMLTLLDDSIHRQRAIEAGADDFLTKPLDMSMLRARIESQLRTKALIDRREHAEDVIFSLALAVEAKDVYTEGHIWRLANFSEQFAVALGLDAEEIRAVRYGGFLHDIGKLGVADTILAKPEPLTGEEYAQIKQHPECGARIIAPMHLARLVGPIVLSHHERWDGSGYPYGLRGKEIPLGARIVAIVDSYDAMTTDRPYRRALSRKETVRRLNARRATQWDPALVDIFVGLVERDALLLPARTAIVPGIEDLAPALS